VGWAGACEPVNSENIRKWEGTQKGPAKLEKAFADPQLEPRLRAEAAVALENIDRHLQVQAIWERLPDAQRVAIAPSLMEVHGARIKAGKAEEARDSRDALFELREGVQGETRRKLELALAAALAQDLRAGRLSEGRHNASKIAGVLPPDVLGPVVEDVLQDPAAPFEATVALVSKLGDQKLNQRAGGALIRRSQKKAEQPPAFWAALVGLAGPEITELLRNRMRGAPEADALAMAKALRARPPGPELSRLALDLAADPQVVPAVRDEMFALVESAGDAGAQERLLQIIADQAQPPAIRYRAFAAALAVGKTQAVVPALQALPAGASYQPEEVTTSLVQPVVQLGPVAREPVLGALDASSAVARLTGVLALEKLGTREDAARLSRLTRDRAAPAGFPRDASVGKEAKRVAAVLKAAPTRAQ
jgi:hypothetical protein